jgi:elongator complex protein 3
MRVQRDIPAQYIGAGPKKGNLREMVEDKLVKENSPIKEIRFRESGQVYKRSKAVPKNIQIVVDKYRASNGDEYFISAEDVEQDILLGFCRLRLGERNEGMIRELHVYGSVTEIGEAGTDTQHKGWGAKLMKKAEEIAKENGRDEMLVISGVGVREYYKKIHGYSLKNHYMWKKL